MTNSGHSQGPQPAYSERVEDALVLAARAFRTRRRKGSEIPYLAHLLQVMVTVAEHGADEDQLIAAVLHDYLEDIPDASVEELSESFGERVASLVCRLSDSLRARNKAPWEQRKRQYLRNLASEPAELKLISAADKLHNAQSILRDHALLGEGIWDRFSATREQTLWYYRCVLRALGQAWQHPLLEELEQVVRTLHDRAGEPFTPAHWDA